MFTIPTKLFLFSNFIDVVKTEGFIYIILLKLIGRYEIMVKLALIGTVEEKEAFNRVIDSGPFQSGSMLKAFRREIQKINKETEIELTSIGEIVRDWIIIY